VYKTRHDGVLLTQHAYIVLPIKVLNARKIDGDVFICSALKKKAQWYLLAHFQSMF